MAVAEISVEPIGTCSTGFGDIVRETVSVLKNEPDLKYDVTAMGTIVEGDRTRILEAAGRMESACLQAGAERCLLTIRLDERVDRASSMRRMEAEVEERISPPSEGLLTPDLTDEVDLTEDVR